ncbi:MAG: hypothetical protein AAF416_14475 [Pseudomonadota bacterium]
MIDWDRAWRKWERDWGEVAELCNKRPLREEQRNRDIAWIAFVEMVLQMERGAHPGPKGFPNKWPVPEPLESMSEFFGRQVDAIGLGEGQDKPKTHRWPILLDAGSVDRADAMRRVVTTHAFQTRQNARGDRRMLIRVLGLWAYFRKPRAAMRAWSGARSALYRAREMFCDDLVDGISFYQEETKKMVGQFGQNRAPSTPSVGSAPERHETS